MVSLTGKKGPKHDVWGLIPTQNLAGDQLAWDAVITVEGDVGVIDRDVDQSADPLVALHVTDGIYEVAKDTGGGTGFAAGAALTLDATVEGVKAATSGVDNIHAYAVIASGDSDDTALVRFVPRPYTLAP